MNKRKAQVSVFYCDDKSNKYFLLLKTNKRRGEFWQNITGSVEEEETFLEGAQRELLEETSIKSLDLKDMNMDFNFKDQWGYDCIEKSYCVQLQNKCDIIIDPAEHIEYKWFNFKDIDEDLIKFKSNYDLIKRCASI